VDINNDTTGEHAYPLLPGVPMNITVTPRQFAAILGGLFALAGLVVLFFMPVSVTYTGLFGAETVDCGTALVTNNVYGDIPMLACSDALTERRAWGWPLTIGGLIVVVAAVFVQSPKAQAEAQLDNE
jgi:uncharacterized membrane protein HdeD (DUF308 family)